MNKRFVFGKRNPNISFRYLEYLSIKKKMKVNIHIHKSEIFDFIVAPLTVLEMIRAKLINQVFGGSDTDGTPSLWDPSLNTQSWWRLLWKNRTRAECTDRPRTLQPLCWEALASSADPSPESVLWEAEVWGDRPPLQNSLMNFFFYKSPVMTCTSLSAPLCRTWTCRAEAETSSPTSLECSSWADEGPPAARRICRGWKAERVPLCFTEPS